MSIARRAATTIAALSLLSVSAVAQTQVPPGPARIKGPLPPPPATTTPAPPPRPMATGISGLQIIAGPTVDVAPLALASASAQCPTGKIALSAAADFRAPAASTAGLEMRGAWPDNRLGTVRVRNANVGVRATVRALVVCAVPPNGLRQVWTGASTLSAGSAPARFSTPCNSGERLVGGGVMGRDQTVIASNAPGGKTPESGGWLLNAMSASPVALPGTVGAEVKALCASALAVDGWEIVESVPVALGAKSQTTLTVGCPAGKGLLAAGVEQRSANLLDIIVDNIVVAQNGQATAHVQNRNTLGSDGDVRAVLTGLCARLQ